MECHICFENVTEDSIVNLECAHSLCQTCLGNLRQRLCPFCRTSIKNMSAPAQPIFSSSSPPQIEIFDIITTIRRRHRRRRRRRRRRASIPHVIRAPTLVESFDMEDIQVAFQHPDSTIKQDSVCDKERQRRRNTRNRWRQNSTHNIINVESR